MAARVRSLLAAEVEPLGAPRMHTGASARATSRVGESDTANYVVARLKRDRPDLAQRVVAGELSANAAALEAGIRKRRILLGRPENVAEALRKHMSPEDLEQLRKILGES